MIPAAPFDHQTREALEAIGNVVALCLPTFPCGKGDCERCEEERRGFWGDMADMADEDAVDNLLHDLEREIFER